MAAKTPKKGILGDAPTGMYVKMPTIYKHRPVFIPYGVLPQITNKEGAVITHENVRSTLQDYITLSKTTKNPEYDLTQRILFSCISAIMLSIVGTLTHFLQNPVSDKEAVYVPLLVGGLAIRYYNQSYLTSDLDVKVFPDNITDSYDPNDILQKIKHYLQQYISQLTKTIGINAYIVHYIKTILYPHQDIPEIKSVLEHLLHQATTREFVIQADFPPATMDKLKIIGSFVGSDIVYKFVDISMYETDDPTYNSIITNYYVSQSGVKQDETYIPPFIGIYVNDMITNQTQKLFIVDDSFMKFEKHALIDKYEGDPNPYFREKFSRALKGLDESDAVKKTYRFLGGKRKTSKKPQRKTTRTIKMKHTRKINRKNKKRSTRRHLLSKYRVGSAKKQQH